MGRVKVSVIVRKNTRLQVKTSNGSTSNPIASQSPCATTASSASSPNPLPGEVARGLHPPAPSARRFRAARSRSGSIPASTASTISAATPRCSRSCRISASPDPRSTSRSRPAAGEALVVHVPDPLERLERLLPRGLADAALLEARVELRGTCGLGSATPAVPYSTASGPSARSAIGSTPV